MNNLNENWEDRPSWDEPYYEDEDGNENGYDPWDQQPGESDEDYDDRRGDQNDLIDYLNNH